MVFGSANAITVSTPVFNPQEADSATKFTVVVSCATSGSVIHYTLNGAEPTIYDPVISSGSTVLIDRDLTLKAKAWVTSDSSATATAGFAVTGAVSAGAVHAQALKSTEAVYAWGSQYYGKLGNNVVTNSNLATPTTPSRSAGNPIADAWAIASGVNQSIILDHSGNPWCYGYGVSGEMGNNDNATQGYAVRVVKSTTAGDWLTGCIGVAAGQFFNGALTSDGKVYTWGSNTGTGRLGGGNPTGSRLYAGLVKKQVSGSPQDLTGITQIDFGDGQGLAKDSNGHLWSWGSNSNGQLGNGGTSGYQVYAAPVLLNSTPTELSDVWDISSGDLHSAVVRWNTSVSGLLGSVWCFGNQASGRLGNGVTTNSDVGYPTQVKIDNAPTYLGSIVRVSAGSSHTLAMDNTGHVWAWGYNGYGALGDGGTANSAFAVKVKKPAVAGPGTTAGDDYLSNVVWISAGGSGNNNFSLAVTKDGTIYAWGIDTSGQMASGSTSSGAHSLPVAVPTLKLLPNFPEISLVSTVNQPNAPGSVSLVATVTDQDGPSDIQKVEFYRNGSLAGTVTASPWTYTLTNVAAGTHHIYAVSTDQAGNTCYSLPSDITINSTNSADTDGDGLPDWWEMQYFGVDSEHLSSVNPDDDTADHDGVSNLDEYRMGTNPTVYNDFGPGTTGYESYGYDDLDRLIQVTGPQPRSYGLDPAGNIESAN
ncbi:Ig-like domain-containing protein [Luteolibacter sp. LG18]|uniref:RCC1 domain-containing protein n=1 Tax=Luteolibacter sp. LG18 TaxID=2819286 RepID=UPI002B290D2A|nr:hypothetical protein llg_27780 [Luteolibacter sp. LG18]